MGFNSNACLWLTRPAKGSTIVEHLLEVLKQENVSLNGEEIHFHDLKSGEERSAELVEGRSMRQCFEDLFRWPALGGIEILHPKVSMGISLELHSLNPHQLEFVTLSMRYGTKSGELDERKLFLFCQCLFLKIEEFGLLFGESPEDDTFQTNKFHCFTDALSRVHELQLKKERGEKGFFEKLMLTRSLNITFDQSQARQN